MAEPANGDDRSKRDNAVAGNAEAAPAGPKVREHPFNALIDRFPGDNLNVLIHFYRGELGRAVAWRQKMDMTTHWAIISTTALVSVTFSSPAAEHIILPFASALIYLLLHIEGRRYRFYDVWRTRVRMLEVHFVVPSLAFEHRLPEGNWRQQLCEDLFRPTYKISYWEALARRLHRNYVWLFLIVFVAWLAKVYLHNSAEVSYYQNFGIHTMIDGKAVAVVSPAIVLTVVLAAHAYIAGLFVYGLISREASGEIRRKNPKQRTWPI